MSFRVMVVDDSKFVYESMQRLLENTDFEIVRYCRDGETAVEAYPQVQPDIVTMDIVLPMMDGFEAAGQILQLDPQARIIFVSSLAYDDTISQAKSLGATEFIFKPIERDALLTSLSRLALEALEQKKGGGTRGK